VVRAQPGRCVAVARSELCRVVCRVVSCVCVCVCVRVMCFAAGLDMGGTWILSILVWQPVLVLVTWGISVVRWAPR